MKTGFDIEVFFGDCSYNTGKKEELAIYINELLINDFQKLVLLLYRVDVDEKKLKTLLQENPSTDAAVLITDLLLQRLEEKQKTKQQHKSSGDIPEDERW